MPRALWTGASGMAAQQLNVDVIANNIANVNTNGFKRQTVNFQDLFYSTPKAPGQGSTQDAQSPTGVQVGHGVAVSSTPRIFTDGNVEVTNNQFDVSIEGQGFFEVLLPDGSSAYTRAGDFHANADGNLVTADGFYLLPQITIPNDIEQLTITPTGVVTVVSGTTQSDIGQLTLSRFQNPAGLLGIGRNLFLESTASGSPASGNPGDTAFGTLRQGSIEKSNVEVVTELVNLIVAQRAYDLNSKSVTTADEMMQTANDIVR